MGKIASPVTACTNIHVSLKCENFTSQHQRERDGMVGLGVLVGWFCFEVLWPTLEMV